MFLICYKNIDNRNTLSLYISKCEIILKKVNLNYKLNFKKIFLCLFRDSTIRISGPLSMYPAVDDNYGVDSCSIMCVPTTPPLVVIAACSGKVYHSVLLKEKTSGNFEGNEVKKKIR